MALGTGIRRPGAFASLLLSHINTEAGENKSKLSFEVVNPDAKDEDEEDE